MLSFEPDNIQAMQQPDHQVTRIQLKPAERGHSGQIVKLGFA